MSPRESELSALLKNKVALGIVAAVLTGSNGAQFLGYTLPKVEHESGVASSASMGFLALVDACDEALLRADGHIESLQADKKILREGNQTREDKIEELEAALAASQ